MSDRISNAALLRVMLLKEIRSTFRERSQLGGLIATVVILAVAVGGMYRSHSRHERSARHVVPATMPAAVATTAVSSSMKPPPGSTLAWDKFSGGNPELRQSMIHWAAIGGTALIGFFFSMGYLLAAVLASFVGEKEARTLEILLASPLSDAKLFLIKCISVLLPSAGIGCFFAVAAALAVVGFVPPEIVPLPIGLLLFAVILGLPIMLLPQLWFVGLGAAVSIRAETVKGASQALGTAMMIIVFGGVYGIPMLIATVPAVRPPVLAAGQWWFGLPFAAQYGMLLILFGVPAVALMALGRACFRRDRMLT